MRQLRPATPLPHRLVGDAKHGYIVGPKREPIDEIPFESWGEEAKALRQTWRYYIHAGNAYPELVAAVKEIADGRELPMHEARALLAKFGEDNA